MDTSLPPAEELALVDRELARLDAHRAQLLARRDWLLRVLHPPVTAQAPAARPVPEAAPRSAQNVLLTLGGVLLTIAAVAFTLVSWGSMGIGGRAAVLGAVTSAALVAPVVLLRKGLASTAESVAALGLVLTLLDAYALHRVALPDTGGLSYTAAASAVLAATWSAYGSALTRLRVPVPAAVVAAQLPLPLGVLAAGGGVLPLAWAALATAALDLVLVLAVKPLPVRVTAGAGAAALGGWALLTGLSLSVTTPLRAAPLLLTCAALLLFAALRHSPTAPAAATVAGLATIAAAGGLLRPAVPDAWAVPGYALCAVTLAAVALWGRGASAWTREPSPGRGAAGSVDAGAASSDGPAAPAGAATSSIRPGDGSGAGAARPVRHGLAVAGAGVLALAVAWALPPVAAGLLGPLGRTTGIWSGAHAERVLTGYPATAPLVLLLAGVALAAVPRLWARGGLLALLWSLLTALPVSLDLAYAPTLTLQLLTTVAALAVAVRPAVLTRGLPEPAPARQPGVTPPTARPAARYSSGAGANADRTDDGVAPSPSPAPAAGESGAATAWPAWTPRAVPVVARSVDPSAVVGWSALACGLGSGLGALALGLDTRAATFAVLGVLAALFAGVAWLAGGGRRVIGACGAVLAVAGMVGAGAAAAQAGVAVCGLALLSVPAGTAAVGARLRRHPVAVPVEGTGAAVGLCALGLTVQRPALLALALALGGVIAAATAVRPERRPVVSWLAAALFLLATWVRLAVWEVTTPEAYTLPVTVPALVVGLLRRRRDPEASSWTAYGPGLAATLVPSLFAAWTDPDWVRPLLLGLAALAVTLLGARYRLQALLLLGGAVLALDGLHELAPYVVQAVGALPRWLPPALAGLLLLAVGATYEQRLRDARRLRERLGRMR
ncbi:SCO7613 C-terminal domain-containing membrane protein [Streptomyces sp. NPDC085481]|uniref:SCO7613 C-terminal domain-containing membrane protein n=1 Tax=Streptomyces sp. NPDC085481 TaxID=3365727 RepID=UPI0037D7787D